MRFLHLADLHIGKRLNEFSLIEDQKFIFDKILNIIDEKKIEAVLIAGDVYDKPVPSAEAVTVLNSFLNSLAKRNLKVFVISGNHDSQERIGFGAELISQSGVYMSKPFSGNVETHKIKDEYGEINIYMLPFIKPAMVKHVYEEADIDSYDSAMAYVMEQTKVDESERNLLIAHQFVRGADRCDSEEVSVGGIDEVSVENFKRFDYVALGHLHGRQKIGRETMRYSGSLLKYSFSEVKQKKSVAVLDLKDKDINIELRELNPLRDLRIIKGNIEDLICEGRDVEEGKEDYIQAILTDDGELMNPMEKLKAVYPNTMLITRERKRNVSEDGAVAKGEFRKKSKIDLFKDFYEAYGSGDYTDKKENVLIDTIKDVLKEEVR